jgi:hypothetical protein
VAPRKDGSIVALTVRDYQAARSLEAVLELKQH